MAQSSAPLHWKNSGHWARIENYRYQCTLDWTDFGGPAEMSHIEIHLSIDFLDKKTFCKKSGHEKSVVPSVVPKGRIESALYYVLYFVPRAVHGSATIHPSSQYTLMNINSYHTVLLLDSMILREFCRFWLRGPESCLPVVCITVGTTSVDQHWVALRISIYTREIKASNKPSSCEWSIIDARAINPVFDCM